jgi:hypothetical protein
VNQEEPIGTQFRVAEAFLEDMGRGLVRLDADDLKRLQAVPGDVLQITGRRATVARAAQAPSSHCGQLLVLIDGTTRGNAQIGVDEWVTVRKVPFKVAESLLLATVQAGHSAPTDHGGDIWGMIAQESAPSLAWRPASLDQVLGDARLCDFKPELEQLAVDARRPLKRVLDTHPPDQRTEARPILKLRSIASGVLMDD